MLDTIPSVLVDRAVREIAKLPGIGKKTALRLVLHLLKEDATYSENLSEAITDMRENITYCKECYNISDNDVCEICGNPKRDHTTICVVEDIRDVIAIENTNQYNGVYHILGGIISPMEGVGPNDLNIVALETRVRRHDITEVILALSSTPEGDTTTFFIFKKLRELPIRFSTIAKGIAFGDELSYTDELTLGRSIINRVPYEHAMAE